MSLGKYISRILLFLSIYVFSITTYAYSPATLWSDIPYGTHPSQRVDFYQPAGNVPIRGLVIWIHGGGWVGGDKLDPDLMYFKPAFDKGLAVLSMNYKLGPDGIFPNSGTDVLSVLDAVEKGGCQNCAYTPDSFVWKTIRMFSQKGIMLSGASAGGYLALLGGSYYITSMVPSGSNLRCINNNVGPVDFRNLKAYHSSIRPTIINFSGGDSSLQKLANMSMTYYAEIGYLNSSARKVKWILNYNTGDTVIPISTTSKFTNLLRGLGAQVYANIANDTGPTIEHNVSTSTRAFWIPQSTSICFGI